MPAPFRRENGKGKSVMRILRSTHRRNARKRRRLGICAGLLLAGAVFALVYSPRVVGASATTRKLPIYCVQRDGKYVSLTFDAAWGDVRVVE